MTIWLLPFPSPFYYESLHTHKDGEREREREMWGTQMGLADHTLNVLYIACVF